MLTPPFPHQSKTATNLFLLYVTRSLDPLAQQCYSATKGLYTRQFSYSTGDPNRCLTIACPRKGGNGNNASSE